MDRKRLQRESEQGLIYVKLLNWEVRAYKGGSVRLVWAGKQTQVKADIDSHSAPSEWLTNAHSPSLFISVLQKMSAFASAMRD